MTSSSGWLIETAKTTSEQAYQRLKRAIIEGEFAPGERLTEAGVASLLGVSRTPVREALARLIKDGLVSNSGRQGIEVVDPRQEFAEIYYIREAIEGCAARLAALQRTREEARAIAALAEASCATDPGDVKVRSELNRRFHLAIADAAHAPRLARLVSDYRELFASPHLLKNYTTSDTRNALDDHQRIAAAIVGGDGDAAEAAMRAHLRAAYAVSLKRRTTEQDVPAGAAPAEAPRRSLKK